MILILASLLYMAGLRRAIGSAYYSALLRVTGMLAVTIFAQCEEPPFFTERFLFRASAFLPQCYRPTLAQIPDGGLACAWASGSGTPSLDLKIQVAFLAPGAAEWSSPVQSAGETGYPDDYPLLMPAPRGGFRLLYATFYNDTRKAVPAGDMAAWHMMYREIGASGRTWGGKFFLVPDANRVPSSRILTLANGAMLLPVTGIRGVAPGFFIARDGGNYWRQSGAIPESEGLVGPGVVELSSGHLLTVLRPDAQGKRQRVLWQTESSDSGQTWAPPQPTGIKNPGGAIDVLKLRNGHLVMIHNDHDQWLTPLTARISTDGGKTWPGKRDLVTEQWDMRDPSVLQTDDGHIHVVYVYRNVHLKHVEMNEAWIRGRR